MLAMRAMRSHYRTTVKIGDQELFFFLNSEKNCKKMNFSLDQFAVVLDVLGENIAMLTISSEGTRPN